VKCKPASIQTGMRKGKMLATSGRRNLEGRKAGRAETLKGKEKGDVAGFWLLAAGQRACTLRLHLHPHLHHRGEGNVKR
jgi:hypothetical protein